MIFSAVISACDRLLRLVRNDPVADLLDDIRSLCEQGNPNHDPHTGEFASGGAGPMRGGKLFVKAANVAVGKKYALFGVGKDEDVHVLSVSKYSPHADVKNADGATIKVPLEELHEAPKAIRAKTAKGNIDKNKLDVTPKLDAFNAAIREHEANGSKVVFHTGPNEIEKWNHGSSFGMDREHTLHYANNNDGVLHAVAVPTNMRTAGPEEIRDAAKSVKFKHDYDFEAADNPQVREHLKTAGFDAMQFRDVGPDNSYEHPTIQILSPEKAKTIATVKVRKDKVILEHHLHSV